MATESSFPVGEAITTVFDPTFVCTDAPDVASAEFASTPETTWCLLELPPDQLALVESGKDFHFHAFSGDSSAEARLSSPKETFGLEFLENSNTLLIAAGIGGDRGPVATDAASAQQQDNEKGSAPRKWNVFAQCRGQLFLKPAVPDTKHLRTLLGPHVLHEMPSGPSPTDISFSQLAYRVAASPHHLEAALAEGPYVEREGRWFLLPDDLSNSVVDVALTVVRANGWDMAKLSVSKLLAEVRIHLNSGMVDEQILRKALQPLLLVQTGEAKQTEGQSTQLDTPTPAETGGAEAAKEARSGSCSFQRCPSAVKTFMTNSGRSMEAASAPARSCSSDDIGLEVAKIQQFVALQLLRDRPAVVRERFQLPAPAPRPKRARVTSSSREGGLSSSDLATAVQESTAIDTGVEDLEKILGRQARFDVVEDSIHLLDYDSLPLDAHQRAKKLFELQSHWKPSHFKALLVGLMNPKDVDAWAMKNTRTVFMKIDEKEEALLMRKFVGV